LFGSGFILTSEEAKSLGYGTVPELSRVIRAYRNGRDITATPRNVLVIDFCGLTADEARRQFPTVYQWVVDHVKPERDSNRDAKLRRDWWLHGRTRGELRQGIAGLRRYISTVETSKHRFFVFLDSDVLPDNMLTNIALDDAYFLGVLSSIVHVTWALAAGGRLGVGNDPRYSKTRCFDPFAFPDSDRILVDGIRRIAEDLDFHRKRQQSLYPTLTMTDMYNVLEKIRSGDPLTAKEKVVHEQGLVSILKQIHDELDRAVLGAYGWSALTSVLDNHNKREELGETILERLVALNVERVEEESHGVVRWLRPEYQNPEGSAQHGFVTDDSDKPITTPSRAATVKQPWPKLLKEQLQVVRAAISGQSTALTSDQIARSFSGARADQVIEILESLEALGQASEVEGSGWIA
jgi:hypothetical protein